MHCQGCIINAMKQADDIILDLKQQGHKITEVRMELVKILLASDTPLTIIDLINKLKDKNLSPNKTTVYREIEFLKDLEVLEEVDFGEGKKRYEISDSHHHHVICVNCKTIKDVSMDKDADLMGKKIMEKMGFKPIGHSLEFFGLCQNCQ